MDLKTKKEIILSYLPSYLEGKGININRNFRCLNPEHADHNPSMSYDRQRNCCHCFSCGVTCSIFKLIQWDYNTQSFDETLQIACKLFGLEEDDNKTNLKMKSIALSKTYEHPPKKKKADTNICDKVYRALKSLCPLNPDDREYLINQRHLDQARINADYFSFKTTPEKRPKLISNLKKLTGYTDDVLKYVPGFFIDKSTGQLDCYEITGIGILIHDVKGNVIAIQVRRYTTEKGRRYCWFTSSFAINDDKYDGGSSPGAAKDVMIPKNPKKCLCITEGRFKAELLAKNRNIVISLQGVTTWRFIDEIIDEIIKEHQITNICLMFDSDIMGNRQLLTSLKGCVSTLSTKYQNIPIKFGVWKIKYGKGIDDCIINGNLDKVKFIPYQYFFETCENSFQKLIQGLGKSFKKLSKKENKEFSWNLQTMNENIILSM